MALLSLTLIKRGIQIDLQYKARNIMWMMHSIIWVVQFTFVWLAIYADQGSIAGFTRTDLVTYFLGLLIIEHLVESFVAEDINKKVLDGSLSQLLLKPISLMRYFYYDQLGFRVMRIIVYGLIFTTAYYLLDLQIAVPEQRITWLYFIIALLLGSGIAFFSSFLVGCLAFWFEEIFHFIMVYWIVTTIPRGWSGPLLFLPDGIQQVLQWLPWQYILYFPMMIFLEQPSPTEMMFSFVVASVWLIVLAFLANFVLKKAIRHYNAVGN